MKYREALAKVSEQDPELATEALDYYRLKQTLRNSVTVDTFAVVLNEQVKRVLQKINEKGHGIVQGINGLVSSRPEQGSVLHLLDGMTKRACVLHVFVELNILGIEKAYHMLRKYTRGKKDMLGNVPIPTVEATTREFEKGYISIRDAIVRSIASMSSVGEADVSLDGLQRSSVHLVPREQTHTLTLKLLAQSQSYVPYLKETVVFYDTPELVLYLGGRRLCGT